MEDDTYNYIVRVCDRPACKSSQPPFLSKGQQQQLSTLSKPDAALHADTGQRCCSILITALGQRITCTTQDRLTNWSSTKDDHILARLNFASSTCVNSHRQWLTHCTLFKTDTLWQLEAELCRVIYELHFETRCLSEPRHACGHVEQHEGHQFGRQTLCQHLRPLLAQMRAHAMNAKQ